MKTLPGSSIVVGVLALLPAGWRRTVEVVGVAVVAAEVAAAAIAAESFGWRRTVDSVGWFVGSPAVSSGPVTTSDCFPCAAIAESITWRYSASNASTLSGGAVAMRRSSSSNRLANRAESDDVASGIAVVSAGEGGRLRRTWLYRPRGVVRPAPLRGCCCSRQEGTAGIGVECFAYSRIELPRPLPHWRCHNLRQREGWARWRSSKAPQEENRK